MNDPIIEWARELQSLAQAGLWYGRDEYDMERYRRIREISAEMLSARTGIGLEAVSNVFCTEQGYQTPKLDTRAAIVKDDRVLLVRERGGSWSLPGGWCEYNLSPAENTVKEAREEAGLDIEIIRLIAVQDRKKHNQPPYFCDVVKIFYLCRCIGGHFEENLETVDSGYFAEDGLPPLAEEKCSADQVRMCFAAARDPSWQTQFD